MSKTPPVHHKEAVRALRSMGFVQVAQKATSHTQWVKDCDGRRLKVTLDEHGAPYTRFLLKSIAKSAGLSVKEFVRIAKSC